MAELARAVAALRIVGEDLDPSEITALLGCEPTTAWAKGETRTTHGVTRVMSFGKWGMEAPETSPADLDSQVSAILDRLSPDQGVWSNLAERYDVDLFCGWFMERLNEGVSLAPETLASLGARRIVLDIDLYGAFEADAPETRSVPAVQKWWPGRS
ncbi:DUF4279 domain-containing protein [Nocardioides sp. LML1-1-1.1]|uniref:DUF4279 domain-containing protein n=1 Tax=Nocardioides sp. LML1-1-1.1 TaxID=3135248 RepID=UPI00341C4CE6